MRALIIGAGQDGSYLGELLLTKGYEVHYAVRRSYGEYKNIRGILGGVTLHNADLTDAESLRKVIREVAPDEVYNQADQDHAGASFKTPTHNYLVTGVAVGQLLEIIRETDPRIKFLQPISSNVFGEAKETPQTENTPLNPRSPYACAKAFALLLCRFYREAYGMFVCCPILYNHESPRRTDEYVTRKITKTLATSNNISLGNTSVKIDWGWAPDFVEAEWLMMQQEKPDDYIVCTEKLHTIDDFIEVISDMTGKHIQVTTDPKFFRPANTSSLVGDSSKIRSLGWKPTKTFEEIVQTMYQHDIQDSCI